MGNELEKRYAPRQRAFVVTVALAVIVFSVAAGVMSRDRLFAEQGSNKWECILPGLDCAVCVWTLSRRLVAPIQKDSHIKSGIVCPRSEHAVVEIEPVHLSPHDVPINLLVDGPTAGINSGEAALVRRKSPMLSGHRGR